MTHSQLLVVLALSFVGLLLLALLVWAVWVRSYLKQKGVRTGSPYSLASLVTDFSAGLNYSHGRLPFALKFFALLLILMTSDLLLFLLLAVVGE